MCSVYFSDLVLILLSAMLIREGLKYAILSWVVGKLYDLICTRCRDWNLVNVVVLNPVLFFFSSFWSEF